MGLDIRLVKHAKGRKEERKGLKQSKVIWLLVWECFNEFSSKNWGETQRKLESLGEWVSEKEKCNIFLCSSYKQGR